MSAEGVPVAWCVMGSNGIFNIGAGDAHVVYGGKPELELSAEKANAVGWHGAPFSVLPLYTHPAAASAEREALLDTVDALLDAVRKFVKKDTPTGLMRLNDAMVAAREAVAAARATKEV